MSPRAAWRLEAAGFDPVYDYAPGKADWLAADLPFQGTAELAGLFTCRGVATVAETTLAAEALRMLEAQGFGPVLVLNQAGVVMGAAYRDALASAPGKAETASVMRFGVSTVRPSEDAAALADRMDHAEVTRVVVTRSDGTLVGLFFAGDVTPQPGPGRPGRKDRMTPASKGLRRLGKIAGQREQPGAIAAAPR